MSILIYIEYDESQQRLTEKSLRTINAAQKLLTLLTEKTNIDLILFTQNPIPKTPEIAGINKIFCCHGENMHHQLPHDVLPYIAPLCAQYEYILAPNSANAKTIMPILSAHLGVAQISDVIEFVSPDTFKKPIYTGNAIASVKVHTKPKLITIRTDNFEKECILDSTAAIVSLTEYDNKIQLPKTTILGEERKIKDGADLQSANIIVSGGRALGSKENFDNILGPLAQKLNAAIGASRAAVDANFAPNECQIGQTGKIVSPNIYIAIGISGAQQHLSGMQNSKTIIAINIDPEAPIIKNADYAIIGDLFEIVPKLTNSLS